MTAINVITQNDAAYVLTDGLLYSKEAKIAQTNFSKCVPVMGRRACVAATGPAGFSFLVAEVAKEYSFDEFVTKSGAYFRELLAAYMRREGSDFRASNLVLVGWLDQEDRPAAFVMDLFYGDMDSLRDEISVDGDPIGELTELQIITLPPPNIDEVKRTGWPIGVPTESRDAERDLIHLAEIQRRQKSIAGRFVVGGEATLTTVTRDGVTQRVVHTWPEDRAGRSVRPKKMDWKNLRRRVEGRAKVVAVKEVSGATVEMPACVKGQSQVFL